VPGSEQVVMKDALHFFEGREDDLAELVTGFLDRVFHKGDANAAASR
jgi:alpha/beta superfamily hydrolase